MTKPFYVTTPIYYVNAQPHIGHIYTTLIADTLARYHRLLGEDVYFMTGTDEHGQKIERAAEAKGVDPQQFCDGISGEFKDAFNKMNMQYDYFIRTSDESHMSEVQKMWMKLESEGYIELGTHEGWYCVSDEAFCTELQVMDVEKDGKTIKVSRESGHPVVCAACSIQHCAFARTKDHFNCTSVKAKQSSYQSVYANCKFSALWLSPCTCIHSCSVSALQMFAKNCGHCQCGCLVLRLN